MKAVLLIEVDVPPDELLEVFEPVLKIVSNMKHGVRTHMAIKDSADRLMYAWNNRWTT